MQRRRFLRGLAGGIPGLAFLPNVAQALEGNMNQLASDLESATSADPYWDRIREEFQFTPGLIHLNCGTVGAIPRTTLDAFCTTLREIEGNPAIKTFGWGIPQLDVDRAQLAEFMGADLDEMALTRNTTEAMNAVAAGIDFRAGDQVLTTNHEHGGGMVCWQHLRKHKGVEIVYAELPDTIGSKQELIDLITAQIGPRTRVCSLSHIDTITGVRMPLKEISEITRPRGILLVCDGAQAPGMLNVDVKALGVDTYAASGHKWMLGPKGTGFLYVRKEIQEQIHPALLYSGFAGYTASGGTRDVAQMVAQSATLEFHNTIGSDRIEARCQELAIYFRNRLERIPALRLLTPKDKDLFCGIVSFASERGDAGTIIGRMRDEFQIILKRAQGTYAYCVEDGLQAQNYNAIRFSTHIYNTEADLDRTADILESL